MTPITIQTYEIGDLNTNCYLVSCDETRECVVIDPADDGEFISDQILANGYTPTAILLTHGHFDHVLGTLALALAFDIPVFLHPADHFLLDGAQKSATHWLGRAVDPVLPAELTIDIKKFTVFGDGWGFSCLETPGHTPGSVCLGLTHSSQKFSPPILFVGDTLFKSGIGRTDFSYSNDDHMRASLDTLSLLPPETQCYPGHGEATEIGTEFKNLL